MAFTPSDVALAPPEGVILFLRPKVYMSRISKSLFLMSRRADAHLCTALFLTFGNCGITTEKVTWPFSQRLVIRPRCPGHDCPRSGQADPIAAGSAGAGGVRPVKAVEPAGQLAVSAPAQGLETERYIFRPRWPRERRIVPPGSQYLTALSSRMENRRNIFSCTPLSSTAGGMWASRRLPSASASG